MIDRLARNPHQCLNLKNEWCLSRKPALENKTKSKALGPAGKEERSEHEETKWKRGRQQGDREGSGEGDGEAGQEDQQRPEKRRNRREEPERDIPAEVKENITSTGASTPVSVKIKRIERGNKKDSGPTGNKYQPTLKSFMDLKCGLEGGRGKTGLQEPGKQS